MACASHNRLSPKNEVPWRRADRKPRESNRHPPWRSGITQTRQIRDCLGRLRERRRHYPGFHRDL